MRFGTRALQVAIHREVTAFSEVTVPSEDGDVVRELLMGSEGLSGGELTEVNLER